MLALTARQIVVVCPSAGLCVRRCSGVPPTVRPAALRSSPYTDVHTTRASSQQTPVETNHAWSVDYFPLRNPSKDATTGYPLLLALMIMEE